MASGLGTATIDFGATPATEATVDVTGQADITSACAVEAWITARSTGDNDAAAHKQAGQQPAPGQTQCCTASFNWRPVSFQAIYLIQAY